jgi:hypothetical protein
MEAARKQGWREGGARVPGSWAAKTLEEFGARFRDDTDLDGQMDEVTVVIGERVQPAHVSFWLVPARDEEGDD